MSVAVTSLWAATAVLLVCSLLLTVFRLLAGPSTLDRLVSLDTFAAVCQCGIGLYIAWTRDTTPAAAMVALALLSFLGSVSATRFRVPDDRGPQSGATAGTTTDGSTTERSTTEQSTTDGEAGGR